MKSHYKHKGNTGFDRCRRQYGRLRNQVDIITSGSGVYRSRRGIFMGVCRGLAEHFDFSVFWTRVIVLLLFLFTGLWPMGVLYIIAGLILKLEPVIPLTNEKDQEFYQSYTNSRESAIQRIKRKFDKIDRRIQRMEHIVTSREFDL
ncbi:MAG: envelope stress response membrane protein PspC [Desulfobacteraceae bacterium]|nr:envelope stress response membrane protein PspC [Desulfobacteraceae bacterium]